LWVAGLVLLVAVGTLWLARSSDREVVTPPPPAPSASPTELPRPAAGAALVSRLADALSEGTRREALALAAPGEPSARRTVAWIYDNVRDLGITDLSMRFVDEEAGAVSAADRQTFGRDAWVGNVALSWRIDRYDEARSVMEVALVFVDTPGGAAFGSSGAGPGSAAPLWLLADLAVEKSRRALVAVADTRHLDRYTTLAQAAVRDVRAVLPRWRGRLVVEVPASRTQLERVLDAAPNSYDSIAAVTATADGSLEPSAPVHVMVNPGVFAGLGQKGAQIVMSHEATHVAVDAATSTMPLWLLEGFADYVALARTELPVSVAAGQILAQVRREGPPHALPGRGDFDPANKLLGTSYEAAWLACRLLAEEYGERRLVSFYDAVDGGASVGSAFADLGTTQAEFTARWREYLRELAG
jgi:hypothetical protein